MTQDSTRPGAGTVTALRRPPVRQSVLVRSDRQRVPRGLGPHPRLPGRRGGRTGVTAVVLYESLPNYA